MVLELDHIAVLSVGERQMYTECWQGSVLGNGGLKGPSGQGGIALNRPFVRSLHIARLSEGLLVRVLRNAVSGRNAARQAARTAVLPALDGR